jgi:hypothetical protein
MNRIKTPEMPKALRDLYEDLRERRLLPLVAVLAIAIVAVPLALSSSGAEVPPPDTSAELGLPSGEGAPAVVVSDPGVRDPQRRLGDRAKRNPFRDLYGGGSADAAGSQGAASGASASGGAADAGADTGGGGGSPASGFSPPVGVPDPVPGSGGEPSEPSEPSEDVPPYVVVIRAGESGGMDSRELSEPTALPGEVRPLAVFTGLSEDRRQAVFRITGSTTAVYGEADCLEGTTRCTRIAVTPGDGVNLVHGEDEDVYRLVVVRIDDNR